MTPSMIRESAGSPDAEYLQKIEQLNAWLRQQFAEYDMLMEATGVCIVKVHRDDGFTVEWCNEAAFRAIGYTRNEYEAQFGYDVRSYFRGREKLCRPLIAAEEAALQAGPSSPRRLTLPGAPSTSWTGARLPLFSAKPCG